MGGIQVSVESIILVDFKVYYEKVMLLEQVILYVVGVLSFEEVVIVVVLVKQWQGEVVVLLVQFEVMLVDKLVVYFVDVLDVK